MDKSMVEQYKQEMLRMARASAEQRDRGTPMPTAAPVRNENGAALSEAEPNAQTGESAQEEPAAQTRSVSQTPPTPTGSPSTPPPPMGADSDMGELIAITTTARELYPVPNASVTVFTGPYDQMDVIAVRTTDDSGRSEPFRLPAPPREQSQSPGEKQPDAEYNMLVQADGYIDNIHLNIPIFRGVTTRQRSPMMRQSPSSPQKGPFIFEAGGAKGL